MSDENIIEGSEKIGLLAAELMESIERSEVEDGLKAKIGVVAIVVELNVDEADGPGFTDVHYRCSDSRRWIQAGFFARATQAVYTTGGAK